MSAIRAGYKQTEVGVIPDDWDVCDLGTICNRVTTGKLDANAMVENGEYRFYTCARDWYYIDNYAFDTEALLISGNGANVGYIHYYSGKFNAYQRTYVLSQFSESIKYVQHYMGEKLSDRIRVEVNAGNTPYITRGTLTEMKLALPPTLAEQEAIAKALSDADALIELLEQLLAKKRHLKQGAMQELLTGRKRLPGFQLRAGLKHTEAGAIPEDWNVVPMGQVSDCLIGLTYSPLDVRDFGTLVLRSSNVQNGKLAFDDNVFVEMEIPERAITQKDDILICVRNGSRQLIGKCALIDEATAGSAFGAFMSVLRSNSARFLFFQFQSGFQKRQIDEVMGATINQITNKDLAEFKVIWPSDAAERTAIAAVLSDIDAELADLEDELAKTRVLKQGMMQKLLTGEIRLI